MLCTACLTARAGQDEIWGEAEKRKGSAMRDIRLFVLILRQPPQVVHTEAKYKQVQHSLNTCAKLTKCSAICAFLLFICCVEVERTIKNSTGILFAKE